ncbi:hypothetical protein R1sor_022683 [Riccia sorocarpa]|uniref:GATA-type domain-containing protein n=1 Tax=Riccia sorocarpa TaxID=122646 RepID=A0ABD3GKI1_9MARC
MLQAPCYPSPVVYGQSHYKKFWLRQTETEDESPVVTAAGPQHVGSCPQKFSTLSSSFTPMAGTNTPPQGQSQGGTSSGTPNPSSSKVSLAACANSFNASRKGVSEYDLNQFEDSSEPGGVDCTLSLGTVKRDRPEPVAVSMGVSRSGSPAFGEVAQAFCNPPESTWNASETQILFNSRNYASDCTRDLYPQTSVPARQGREVVVAQSHVYCGPAGSTIEGSKTSGFPRPKKSPVYGTVEKKVVGASSADAAGAIENSNEDVYRALVVPAGRSAIGLCRSSSSWMPSLVIPEVGVQPDNKYSCETPSPFSSSMIASPLSGHSSVSGDDGRFQHRSSNILEIGGNVASSSAKTVARTCAHCNTQKTPLWRNGPNGPKSLCNACGIRFKKAGKKNNPSTGSSSELGSPLPVSPTSAKTVKRKKHSNSFQIASAGLSKHSNWGLDDGTGTGRRGYHQPPQLQCEAPHPQPWKRNRASTAVRMEMTERLTVDINDTTTTESSASEGDENETGGSSGNSSCVTWQQNQRSSVAAATALTSGAAAAATTVLQVPSASAHAFATVGASDRSPGDSFIKMNDVMSMFPYKRAAQMTTMEVDPEDSGTINAEEAALCLMKLSHGFGLRPDTGPR